MVLVCVSLIAIMGMIGVVTDFSFLQDQRNIMQTAADSAAMAGAEELNYGDQVAAGRADAASNGYINGTASVTVALNNPPTMGPNTANSGYVEAIVTKPVATYFLRALGVSTITVSARAVAYEGNGPNCIYVLNPSASGAFSANGNVTVNSSCGMLVDSSSSSGMTINGNVTVTAPTIGVVGNYTSNGNSSFSPTPKTGVISASDPLAYLQAPAVGSCAHTGFSLNGNTGSSGSPYQTVCGHLLRRNFRQRQLGTAFQRRHIHPRRRRHADKRQLDDDRDRGDLLQHDRDRRLRRDYDERQLAGEFQCADLGCAGGNPVLSGSLDPEQRGVEHD